jgi:hypothetical protein
MCQLIDELKKEHVTLLHMLSDFKDSTAEQESLLELLSEFRELLFEHLKKEERLIYHNLREKSESDSKLENMLNNHSDELLKQIITDYCIRYRFGRSVSNISEYATTIYDILKSRIISEEMRIFPEYLLLQPDG